MLQQRCELHDENGAQMNPVEQLTLHVKTIERSTAAARKNMQKS